MEKVMIAVINYDLHDSASKACHGSGNASVAAGRRKIGEQKEQGPFVITPGGPRKPEQVHPVGADETLRRNPDGTYSVIPDQPKRASHAEPPTQK
jgi:hypothetical protein